MVQLTLIQIDNYGPWTVTPEPRRESDLQSLQADIYSDVNQGFGAHGCLAFYNRFDNMVAVSDGTTEEHHRRLQEYLDNHYPVTVSMASASAPTPREAITEATELMQREGSAQDSARESKLVHEGTGHGGVEIAHFDVEDATRRYTDEVDAFEANLRIQRTYSELAAEMWEEHDSTTYFVGGDNYISVTPGLDERDYRSVVDRVEGSTGTELRVGVGEASEPCEAGMKAKEGLEESRDTGTSVEFVRGTA